MPSKAGIRNDHAPPIRFTNTSAPLRCSFNCTVTCLWQRSRNLTRGSLNGVIPEDTAWADPFAKMRVQGEQSERTSFENTDLKLLFAAPISTKHEYPEG